LLPDPVVAARPQPHGLMLDVVGWFRKRRIVDKLWRKACRKNCQQRRENGGHHHVSVSVLSSSHRSRRSTLQLQPKTTRRKSSAKCKVHNRRLVRLLLNRFTLHQLKSLMESVQQLDDDDDDNKNKTGNATVPSTDECICVKFDGVIDQKLLSLLSGACSSNGSLLMLLREFIVRLFTGCNRNDDDGDQVLFPLPWCRVADRGDAGMECINPNHYAWSHRLNGEIFVTRVSILPFILLPGAGCSNVETRLTPKFSLIFININKV